MAEELDVEVSELEAVETQKPEKQEPELPAKYRGKSVEDIVKMHQEAEKLASRHAQEVGEVRKLADELLKSQLAKKPEEKPKEIDFFENPSEAINQAVNMNPRVLAAEQYALQVQREQAKQMFFGKHPDAMDIAQDSEFQEWVGKSKVRQKLLHEADRNFDFDAGDELISTWKELRTVKKAQTESVEKKATDSALNAASVDLGGSGESSRKIYRRADLIRLKMNNPSKYEAMYEDIAKAYAENRVR